MDNRVECICIDLYQIESFNSIYEFERFEGYIRNLVERGELTEVTVTNHYAGFPEKWFQCTQCNQIWRLVYPDFPFKGLWDKITI
jgi:hypothetical protein